MHEIEKRMRELEKQLEYHSKRYYEEDSPEISDREYDMMFAELKQLEEENPTLASPASPTGRVGGAVAERFGDDLKIGVLSAVAFPILLVIVNILLKKKTER